MMFKHSLIAAALLGASAVHAGSLDFGNGPDLPTICSSDAQGTGAMTVCGNSSFINQGYGDTAGVLDVSYSQPLQTSGMSLRWWASDYNDLFGVPWADGGDGPQSYARIDMMMLGGHSITLKHFDFGAYYHTTRDTIIDIFDLGSNQSLFHYAGSVGADPNHTPFDVSITSAAGLRIEWQDSAYNVGIDNIAYDIDAGTVPEPSTLALLLASALGFAGLRAKRRG